MGPPKFYGERLFLDVIGEQASKTADNPLTLSEDTVSVIFSENEKDCRETLVAQSIEQHSPIISQNPTEVVPETKKNPRKKKYRSYLPDCCPRFYKIRVIRISTQI